MDVHEYLKKVSDQILEPGIRGEIEKELNAHLEDQKEAFMMDGMEEAEAEEAAVLEMGDPVEVGIRLNEIHKPKPVEKYIKAFLGINCFWFLLDTIACVWRAGVHILEDGAGISVIGSALVITIDLAMLLVFYGNIVHDWSGKKSGYRSPFSFTGFLTVYGVVRAVLHKMEHGSLDAYNDGILWFLNSDPQCFHSLLFFTLEFLLLLTLIRKSKTSRSDVFVSWLFMNVPAVYLLWENSFMLLEITSIYAAVFTLVYLRGWFLKKSKYMLYLYWSLPLFCILKLLYLLAVKNPAIRVSFVEVPGKPTQTYLYNICSRFGSFPAWLVLLLGIYAEVQLFFLFRRMRSEWGKLLTFTAVLIFGVLLLNGGLALLGMLPQEYLFAPFLWKIGTATEYGAELSTEIDYMQILMYYAFAGYLTRFISRDSLLNLEMEAAKTESQKKAQKKNKKAGKKNLGFLRKTY